VPVPIANIGLFSLGELFFLNLTFSDVMSFYHQRKGEGYESCLSLCSCNQSCVAVSYDKNTSTCFLSDKPEVIINTEQIRRLCSVKNMVSEVLVVYGFSTDPARSKENSKVDHSLLSIRLNNTDIC